jgi:hypothetical protein
MDFPKWPSWRFGPNGQSAVFESEADVPNGWVDHPSKVKGFVAEEGTQTAVAPANSTVSADQAAKTTEATSQTATDPAQAAKSGVGGAGNTPEVKQPASTSDEAKGADPTTATLDAYGHVYDPSLHAGTGSKTKAGLWRMKVGVKRPDPAPGYPKAPEQPLDL